MEEITSNLRKMQLMQLEILDEIEKICQKNKIKFYLIGGTLIGAIRHNGFIPWDDDIDIAMKREDYEKFIKIAVDELREPFAVRHFSNNNDNNVYILKIINKNVVVVESKVSKIEANVFIDILPIDGIPNNKIIRILYKIKLLYCRMLIGFTNIDKIRDIKRNFLEKILIKFATRTKIGKHIDRNKVWKKVDKLMKKYKYDECNLVGTVWGNYFFKEIVPKEYFGKGSKVMFEGKEYIAPELVDKYLTHMYGDYMELPPLEKRVGHHISEIYFLDGGRE